ncbi:MAG: ATP-binding domain-containing protein [Planctomycetes bacterium]|nr:ATP-binding domain-containing protein [Planctomycetota bacterium]
MNVEELKSKCIEASKFYYDYLEKNKKGIERINITAKKLINAENDTWELHIGQRLFNLDSIKIHNRQYDEYYNLENFSIQAYDADNKLLILKFTTQTHFGDTPANNLQIISDLKFLIKNVENWYTRNGLELRFNSDTTTGEDEVDDSCPFDLNHDQMQAFKSILRHRYNYIWGPPGTGKTRYVLISAVLHYLNSPNPKIGIFAPTNNALEQVLESVIKHFDRLGISKEKLLRVGGPSKSYAEKYPETCEIQGLEKKLEEIKRQINNIENVLEYRRGKFTLNSVFAIQKYIQEIIDLEKQWRDLLARKAQKEDELAARIKKSKSLKTQLQRIFKAESQDYSRIIKDIRSDLSDIQDQINKLNTKIEECILRIKNVETRSERIKKIIHDIDIQNYLEVADQLSRAKDEIDHYLKVNDALNDAYSDCDDARLHDQLTKHEENYRHLRAMQIDERIRDCSVIGMTLDSYIGRFSDVKINFSTILVDEAGYVPLIKALTLFSNRCGITFLGDHKQLPPVCEFDNINKIPGFHRLLWSKPSIFAETMLNCDEEECLDIASEEDCPEFRYTKKTILKESHRFGANLAEMLNTLIYDIGYRSALENNIDLYFINVPNPDNIVGRKNENECSRISNILNGHLDEDYCILTPYKGQVALLQTRLPNARREERISTIHKSQGREWDTVIFSVVDGSNSEPWFTDSSHFISQGKYVLNTAISRAKKKLIIVCDVQYWSSRSDADTQLISNLIKISERYD